MDVTSLKASISWVTEVKKDLTIAKIDIANTSERNILENKIDKWKVTIKGSETKTLPTRGKKRKP